MKTLLPSPVLMGVNKSMADRRERLFNLFESRIYGDFFKDLSGWDRAASGLSGSELTVQLSSSELNRYFFDQELPNTCLEDTKSLIATLISLREGVVVQPRNLLLTPGATAALSVILHFLRASGVEIVLADPPFYFSIETLCGSLGIKFKAVRRSVEELDDHDRIIDLVNQYSGIKKAIILTHPRYVVSRNYPAQIFSDIRCALTRGDFLIIDQSVDMEFQNQENFAALDSSCIKVRTIGKALGMNGSRLAAITAGEGLIRKLNRHAGILYGSLDVAMLKLGSLIAQAPESFASHLQAMRKLVEETALESRLTLGNSVFKLVLPENGFLGYILVDTTKIGRFSLYQSLLRESVHAMFSAHVGLEQLYHREMIRVNYLLDIKAALMVLRRIAEHPRQD